MALKKKKKKKIGLCCWIKLILFICVFIFWYHYIWLLGVLDNSRYIILYKCALFLVFNMWCYISATFETKFWQFPMLYTGINSFAQLWYKTVVFLCKFDGWFLKLPFKKIPNMNFHFLNCHMTNKEQHQIHLRKMG